MTPNRSSLIKTVACMIVAILTLSSPLAAVSVKDFGAVGDGKADDSEAFAKAFEAAAGQVLVPAGRYVVKDVNVPDGVALHGVGSASVITIPPDAAYAFSPGNECTIRHLKFVGHRDDKASPITTGFIRVSTNGVTLTDLVFENAHRGGIITDHATSFRFSENRFKKVGVAISIQFSRQGLVQNNIVEDCAVHGIQFWGNWKYEVMDCADLIFTGNYIRNGGGGAIWGTGAKRVVMANNIIDTVHDVGLDPEWCEDVTIIGNTVRNCETAGIALFLSCKNVAITGNTIVIDHDEKGRRDGIWLTGVNTKLFKGDTGHSFISITGNTIIGHGPKKHGIAVESGDHIVCAANVMENADIFDRTGNVKVLDAPSQTASAQDIAKWLTVIPHSQRWRFKTDPKNVGVNEKWFAENIEDGDWATLRSDQGNGWESQGFDNYTGYAWYRSELPAVGANRRAKGYLHFQGVDEQAWVYLNGKLIFEHTVEAIGRSINALYAEPFSVDVIDALRAQGPNMLAVRVHNAALMGGIWQPVYLVMADKPIDTSQQFQAVRVLSKASE